MNKQNKQQKETPKTHNRAIKTTSNCGVYSLYPSDDGKSWKWLRFNSRKNRGGLKDLATLAKKAGFAVNGPITNIGDARLYVETAIQKGILLLPGQEKPQISGQDLFLRDFVRNTMDPKAGLFSWLQGNPDTRDIAITRFSSYESSFRLHGYDVLPAKLKFLEATHDDIERFIRKLRENGESDDIIRNCLQAVRKTYSYAIHELKIASQDPTEKIKVKCRNNKSKRDLLRPHELITLLKELKDRAEHPSSRKKYAKSIYIAVKLMIHTGMREGEVRALKISKLERVLSDKGEQTKIFRIRVDSSWETKTNQPKGTKSGKPRDIYIWEDLAEDLIDLYNDKKSPSGLIFCSASNPDKPFVKDCFESYLYPVLDKMGITEEQRTQRLISVHSFRHGYITYIEARASSFQWHKNIMTVTGHDTESAHSRYMQDNFFMKYRMATLSRDILKEDDLREIYKDALIEN